ncbi:hypothetical protein Agub_g4994, partial [Astrephomene gubernaculifera]
VRQDQQLHASGMLAGDGSHSTQRSLSALLACSHDGDVACLDAATGVPYWHVRLPARAEAGMAIAWGRPAAVTASEGEAAGSTSAAAGTSFTTGPHQLAVPQPYVVVACGDERLYSLDLGSGAVCGDAVDCGGEFKCPPVVDPWVGAVWATGHGRHVTVMRPPSQVLARFNIGAPMSTPVIFATMPSASPLNFPATPAAGPFSHQPQAQPQPQPQLDTQHQAGLALVTALDGSTHGLRVGWQGGLDPMPAELHLEWLWAVRGPAPLFSAPLLIALPPTWQSGTEEAAGAHEDAEAHGGVGFGSGSTTAGEGVLAAVVGHVDGSVRALRLGSGGGDGGMQPR